MRLAVEVSTCSAERTGIGYYTAELLRCPYGASIGARAVAHDHYTLSLDGWKAGDITRAMQ